MRLLFITHCGVRGGTGLRALAFAQPLAQRGHEVHLIARRDDDVWRPRQREEGGVRIHESPLGRGERWAGLEAMPWDLLQRRRIASRLPRFDAVLAFDMLPNNAGVYEYVRRRDRCPGVVDWADLWTGGGILDHVRRPGWMRRWSHRLEISSKLRADGVTAISRWLYRRARELGVPEARLCYLPAGADIRGIPVRDRDAARRRVGLPADWRIVCALGSTGADETLVRAVAPVLRRDPAARLLVLGPRQARAEQLAAELGLGAQLLQPGFQDPNGALPDYLAAVDVFALTHADEPNNWARWPQRVGSFLAAGRPFVTNRVGEMIEFLAEYPVGRLADDLETDFARQVEALLTDRAAAAEMGRRGRRLAETEWSWDAFAGRLEEFLLRLHAEAPR